LYEEENAMKGKGLIITALAFTLLPVASPNAQEYPKLTLRFAHFVPATLPGATVDQWFAEELSKRTKGQVTMQFFWAESGGKSMELLKLSAQGGVDVSATAAGYFPSQIPFLAAASIPVATSARQAKAAWTTLYDETPALQEEARNAGVQPMLWHPIPAYHLLCRMPIRNLEDLKGKKLRSWGEEFPRVWQAVGATAVTVLPGEWYESLQRGTIDCMLHSWDTLVTYKMYEVGKYASTINLGALISWPQWWNLKKWESLPPNLKQLVTGLAREADPLEIDRLNDAERKSIDIMKANGVQFIEFADQKELDKLTPDFITEWTKKMDKLGKGPEAIAMAKRWRELLAQNK
jgi:TRAP-type C4-dicarboxylate transport system substrate-binding protein